MNTPRSIPWLPCALSLVTVLAALVLATEHSPDQPEIERLANGEVIFRFKAAKDHFYRIEASENFNEWTPLATVEGDESLEYLDSEASYLAERHYRSVALEETDVLTGDHIVTADGVVTIHPVDHASFVMEWNGKFIYNDPVGGASPYRAFPRADLILVGHEHGDHFNAGTLNPVKKDDTMIVTPASVFGRLSSSLKESAKALGNGDTMDAIGLNVEAVPAYNDRHPKGRDNGYVLTIGGVRFYMSGDTGDIDEMRSLSDIDVAFICMNLPFTMSVDETASAVRDFKPKIVYPYHHRGSNLKRFKEIVGKDVGVGVRLREWY
jgi:L-ascorbate metabolism protein UlaG (beta-lactamase superfamily)